MKKFTLALFALAAALAITPAALADATWNWTLTGSITGSGTISYSSTPDLTAGLGAYDITGVTGTFDGLAITGLFPVPAGTSTSHPDQYGCCLIIDDLFYPNNGAPALNTPWGNSTAGGYLDLYGVGFVLADGELGMIYGNGGGDYAADIEPSDGSSYSPPQQSGNSFQVPEGGTTLLLLGLAVAGLAGLRRKLSA